MYEKIYFLRNCSQISHLQEHICSAGGSFMTREILGWSYCLSGKVNIRQGALQPQMGMGPKQWLTVTKIQPHCFFRGISLCEINSLRPVGESMHTTKQYQLKRNTFAQESRVMPRVLGRREYGEGKACNMILAMHGTLLQRILCGRKDYRVIL